MDTQQKVGWHFLTQTRYSCVNSEEVITTDAKYAMALISSGT